MRILMTAFPGHGHLQPMLPLARAARAARAAGQDVVIATGPDLAPDVERRGFTALAVGSTMAEAFASGAGRQAPDSDDRFVIAGTVVFVPAAERLATDLLPWAERWAPDVVVSETLELGGLIVADRVGARRPSPGPRSASRPRSGPCRRRGGARRLARRVRVALYSTHDE